MTADTGIQEQLREHDHGGDLDVSSGPTRGTTFIARIPVHWE